jgi:pyridoxamine 5'-phosphate oxidase-like protein
MEQAAPGNVLDAIQDRTFARVTPATLRAYPLERRLTGSRLTGYLDRRSTGVVSSARPDGRPHSALSSFLRRGATFWLPTFAGTVRERNVRTSPWLVLVVAEGEGAEHIAVIIEGPAAVIPPAAAPASVTEAFGRSWVSAWLRLDAEHVLSYADDGRG